MPKKKESTTSPPASPLQQAEDEAKDELRKTLDEARQGLNAFKKMLTLFDIPGLKEFIKNFEKELAKIEKKAL